MAKDKKSFRDDLEKLAEITDIIDNTILSNGDINIVVELESEEYKKVLSIFGDVYRTMKEIVVDISGTKFTFVLKK